MPLEDTIAADATFPEGVLERANSARAVAQTGWDQIWPPDDYVHRVVISSLRASASDPDHVRVGRGDRPYFWGGPVMTSRNEEYATVAEFAVDYGLSVYDARRTLAARVRMPGFPHVRAVYRRDATRLDDGIIAFPPPWPDYEGPTFREGPVEPLPIMETPPWRAVLNLGLPLGQLELLSGNPGVTGRTLDDIWPRESWPDGPPIEGLIRSARIPSVNVIGINGTRWFWGGRVYTSEGREYNSVLQFAEHLGHSVSWARELIAGLRQHATDRRFRAAYERDAENPQAPCPEPWPDVAPLPIIDNSGEGPDGIPLNSAGISLVLHERDRKYILFRQGEQIGELIKCGRGYYWEFASARGVVNGFHTNFRTASRRAIRKAGERNPAPTASEGDESDGHTPAGLTIRATFTNAAGERIAVVHGVGYYGTCGA